MYNNAHQHPLDEVSALCAHPVELWLRVDHLAVDVFDGVPPEGGQAGHLQ